MDTTAAHSKARLLLLIAILPGPLATYGQGTREDYVRAEKFLPWNVRHLVSEANVTPHWIEGSHRFWYRKEGASGAEFLLVDADRNTREPAFDHAKLAAALSAATGKGFTATKLPFESFEFKQKGAAVSFEAEGSRWTCTLSVYQCAKDAGPAPRPNEVASPDGKWMAFVDHYNLYARDASTGEVVQLTHDGEKSWDYATPLPSSRLMVEQGTEDVRQRPGVFWSPDSSKLVTYRIDSRHVGRFTTLQFVPPDQLRPKAYTYVYPLPGEVLSKAEPIIFDIQSGKRIEVQTDPLELEFQGGPEFEWFKDSKRFHYLFHARGYKQVVLREVDAGSGQERAVVEESSEKYVDPGENYVEMVNDGAEVLWASERDGWNHLYLYNGKTGQLENQVTKGPWVVRGITHVDEKARRVYFVAGGREPDEDPYQTHLYQVNFDGSGLKLLTPENANHTVRAAPDGAYFVDNYSRPDLPGESALRRLSDGGVIQVLEKTDAGALMKTGWKPPEPFHGKAADGKTDIYGLIWRPSNFDAAKKYPVIEQVYTGPQSFFVPKSFAAFRAPEQLVAELGFIVVMVDGRGTTGRSREFHEFSYRNLGGAFDDHMALIQQMGARYPAMDLSRVGIYGTSAGGYGAAHAMLVHPEFYKVGVSISGDHDPRLDKAWWNELYQGYPMGEDYVAQSNVTLADRLTGHLLLVHGDVDDNVNPVETMRFADALIKANKNFDMLLVPNMFHGEGRNTYAMRRRWDYFVQHLLGVAPPADFAIKPDETPERAGNR
ncbi:MAG TPA: DPP IV N-terminal domain-containing protein [Terriglobia bacterium]|nr:DPP IV N-terminal domain-containing protein [Terriglobia bacterium]